MRRFMAILCLVAAAFACTTPSRAAELSATDARNVRAVIQAQLAAFEVDDAARAFSFATPQLREAFGTAENFLEMVRNSYPVVYRHASVAFLKPRADETGVTQGVHFTDGKGVLWLALYRLERQRDRGWRISGCQAMQTEGRAA